MGFGVPFKCLCGVRRLRALEGVYRGFNAAYLRRFAEFKLSFTMVLHRILGFRIYVFWFMELAIVDL